MRTRSQALVDGKLLIDYPADTLYHTHHYGLRLHRTHGCLLTHVHHDHFIPEEFFARTEVAALMKEEHPFHFYTTELGLTRLRATPSMGKLEAQGRMLLHRITPFEPFEAEGYTVTPLGRIIARRR
jgi:phosphoribosyl 1,2-cyclic phosphate phosphodiesterase